jgi:hypothetical protein
MCEQMKNGFKTPLPDKYGAGFHSLPQGARGFFTRYSSFIKIAFFTFLSLRWERIKVRVTGKLSQNKFISLQADDNEMRCS